MNKLLLGLFLTGLLFYPYHSFAQKTNNTRLKNARIVEQNRDIRLPEHDDHFEPIKNYVENIPDTDYFHASEKAYDAFNDIKFGIRIHWGIYSIWQMNHESWGFLELSDQKKQAYQNLYKTFIPVGFNAEEWMGSF